MENQTQQTPLVLSPNTQNSGSNGIKGPVVASDGTQLDQSVVTLAKSIRSVESQDNYNAHGQSGEFGAYQFLPQTWKAGAQQYLNDANAPMTPINQDKVAYYKVKELKDAGHTPEEVASIWNSGHPQWIGNIGINQQGVKFDTPTYVNDVVSKYSELSNQQTQPQQEQTQTKESPSVGGFVSKAFESGLNVAGSLGNMVLHPIKTVEWLASTVAGAGETGLNKLGITNINNKDTQNFDSLINYYGTRYGGNSITDVINNIGKTLYNDPVGAALDLSMILDAGASAVGITGKLAELSKIPELAKASEYLNTAKDLMSKGAEVTNPITPAVNAIKGVAGLGGKLVKTGVASLTNLPVDVMKTVIDNPEAFTKMARENADSQVLLNDLKKGIERLNSQVDVNGQLYKGIRGQTGIVNLPESFISDILTKGFAEAGQPFVEGSEKATPFKLNLEPITNKNGEVIQQKVVADSKSFTRDVESLNKIQAFIDNWYGKTSLTPDEFINMRSDANELGNVSGSHLKNRDSALVGKQISADLNKYVRPNIKGLKEVDTIASPAYQLSKKIKSYLLNPDGTFKDNATIKVSNALNKEGLMTTMEKVSPGITHNLEILKATEAIEKAEGIKLDNYAKNAATIFGATTGNIPLVVGMIISHPEAAVQILRGFGYTGKAVMPILGRVRAMLGALPLSMIAKVGIESNQIQSSKDKPIK